MKTKMLLLFTLVLPAFALDWQTDLDEAKKQALSEGKILLINFSGSDWCGWCKKLDREVFSQDEFTAWAQDKFVCLLIDFPKYKPQSREEKLTKMAWRDKFQVESFPTILLVDAESDAIIYRMGYQPGGTDKFIERLGPFVKKQS